MAKTNRTEHERAEEEALVIQAQSGDIRAFDDLVERFAPRLYSLIYNMTSNREDTSDLLQDTFSRAFRGIAKFQGKSSFSTWLYRIATNATLNHLRKRKNKTMVSLDDLDNGIANDEIFADPHFKVDPRRQENLRELQLKLNAALQSLSVEHRTAVTLFDIQGLPHAEIARILKVSEGTVRSRLFYAHRLLQTQLMEFRD